jgi:hypothetical protein
VELPFDDHMLMLEAAEPVLENVRRFADRIRDEETEFDRVLATVLFTEIRAQHDRIVRANLGAVPRTRDQDDGRRVPRDLRRTRSRRTVRRGDRLGVKPLGIEVRAGVHTGEVAFEGDDVAGLGVAIGARVGAKARGSEVLVSQTVKDLVAGSRLTFEDAGEHELKGVADRWHLYRVVDRPDPIGQPAAT